MILKYGQQAGWSTETWRRVEMLSAQQWADTLALPYGGRLGGEGRLETLPHIGCLLHKSSVPHKGSVNSGGERNSSEADHRHKAAGVARKTECSTERSAWQAWRLAPLGERLGEGEQRVKGTQAGWKAGRRLESLPHIRCSPQNRSLTHKEGARHQNACTIVGVGMSSQANHRQDCRCGTQD
jgi:hypothetical protein